MNRRKFFKRIGITSIGVIIAPSAVNVLTKKSPAQREYGIAIPKRRRSESNLITNYDLTHPELIKNLYRKYGNQKMNYFQLLKSLNK